MFSWTPSTVLLKATPGFHVISHEGNGMGGKEEIQGQKLDQSWKTGPCLPGLLPTSSQVLPGAPRWQPASGEWRQHLSHSRHTVLTARPPGPPAQHSPLSWAAPTSPASLLPTESSHHPLQSNFLGYFHILPPTLSQHGICHPVYFSLYQTLFHP